jgi:hypothetical protein
MSVRASHYCLLFLSDVTIGFLSPSLSVTETDSTTNFDVTVMLIGRSTINITVMFSTQDGTAICEFVLPPSLCADLAK